MVENFLIAVAVGSMVFVVGYVIVHAICEMFEAAIGADMPEEDGE
jgi:hypothetical protein